MFQPELVTKLGRSTSIFLERLNYYLTHDKVGITHDNRKWVYNTAEQWADELKVYSARTVKRCISHLRKLGIILVRALHKHKAIRTNYFTIDYERLKEFLGTFTTGIKENLTTQKTSQLQDVETEDHRDKMAHTSGQNGTMYNHRRQTQNASDVSVCLNKSHKSEGLALQNALEGLSKVSIASPCGSSPFSEGTTPYGRPTKQVDGQPCEKLAATLLRVWNEEVASHMGTKSVITKWRARMLMAAFKIKFDNRLEKWREFCLSLRSSDFLMGRSGKFKASLDWILKFETLQKIEEGNYGVEYTRLYTVSDGNFSGVRDSTNDSTDAQMNINEQEEWGLRLKIMASIGEANYNSWFINTFIDASEKRVKIYVENNFTRDWIMEKFGDDISVALEGYPPGTKSTFQIISDKKTLDELSKAWRGKNECRV